ncbi:MAG TPA: K(+)-transporting ATPase subunit F [Miltoncostaeaceae bacterium]|nr:K(+)-transporting ATPase subunit F [Miltoncostaeaceae bacterium]
MGVGDIAALVVATAVLVYLLYALFRAERF